MMGACRDETLEEISTNECLGSRITNGGKQIKRRRYENKTQ